MVVILLIIIACVLLFGKEATKDTIKAIVLTILILAALGWLLSSCGA